MSPPATSPAPRGAALLILGAGLAFATSGPLARWARPLHPLMLACGRVALAALLLAALDARGVRGAARALAPRKRARVLAAGGILAAHFGLFQCGLDTTSLPAAVSLVSLEPLSVVLWAWATHGLRPSRIEQVGVMAATLGALLVARGAGVGEHRLLGDVLVLGAVVLYGAYISVAREFRGLLDPRHYAALVYGAAALALGPTLVLLRAQPGVVMWPIPTHAVVAVLALALVPTTLGHTAVQAAAQRFSPGLVALVSPLESLGALAIAAALLAAVPTPVELAGAAAIIAGVCIALVGQRTG
ncbi:MAG TPA: DMT family transporter [Polyangia bacterium]|nr:DMT family transporter [Polyangia bacterium]